MNDETEKVETNIPESERIKALTQHIVCAYGDSLLELLGAVHPPAKYMLIVWTTEGAYSSTNLPIRSCNAVVEIANSIADVVAREAEVMSAMPNRSVTQ